MASWKLPLLVLLAVVLVVALGDEDARRRRGRRRYNNNNNDNNDNNNVSVDSRRGVRRRHNGRISSIAVGEPNGSNPRGGNANNNDGARPPRRGGRGRGRGRGRRPSRGRGGRGGRGNARRQGGRRRPHLEGNAQALLAAYSVANGNFGVGLYKEMKDTADNFAISPLSIHTALGMLLLGSSGRTKSELVRGLHVRSPIHPAFRIYNQSLEFGEGANTTLMLANALYTQQGFSPKSRYVNKLRMFYDSELSAFDEDDPEGVINDWVAQKTMQKIEDFLDDGEVTDDMVMMLINAVYFKGAWESQFDEDQTSLETFTDSDMDTHQVYMLNAINLYKQHSSAVLGARLLKMPYKGGRYSLNIILPNDGIALDVVESRLTHEELHSALNSLKESVPSRASLTLPKFSIDTEQSMKDILQAMGISNVFESNANFRRMTTSRNIVVSKVKHRCIIEVDETGTEAAATTSGGVVLMSLPLPFRADKPFMFILRDDLTSVNLFMGRYANPQGDNMAT